MYIHNSFSTKFTQNQSSLFQSTHLYLYLTAQNGCRVLVPQYFCLILRGPMSMLLTSFVPLNAAIVIERLIATKQAGSYETKNSLIGCILVTISVTSLFGYA